MSKIQKHIKIWKSKSLINFVEFCLKAYFALYLCTKQAAKSCTLANHAEKLKRHANWSITGQKVQTGHSVSSWLELSAQSSRETKPPASSVLEKLTLRIPNTHKYKYPTYPRNIESFQREYWERNPRENPQSSHRDSSNSFTLTLSIVVSLRDSLPKPFPIIPTSMRRPFGAWEAIGKGSISYWLMLWFIAKSGKLKKK